MDGKHYVYILRCADGTLYTGWTTDPERRLRTHNSGRGAKYTRARRPVELVYIEEYDDKVEAQRREYAIKQLTRAEKEKLILSKGPACPKAPGGGEKMPELSRRVGTFTDSVIRRMTRISNKYGAINMSQGFPDFDPPAKMKEALGRIAAEGPHQYSITYGALPFREALARKQSKSFGREIDPEKEVVITCGGTEAMMCAMMTACDPGDKVMLFSPFYENYGADAILSGVTPVYIPLVPPEYGFDPDLIEEGFRSGAKAIIVCNPSNPCGKVFTEDELRTIGDLALKYGAFVIMDEVYEHMVYAPRKHVCMASLPGMYENTVTCGSLSKTYSITGWRLGWLVGPEKFVDGAKKVHDFLTVGAPSPLQAAAVTGLEFGEEYYEELLRTYTEKRAYFLEGLDRIGLKHNVPEGTYFVLVDIGEFLEMPKFRGWTDLEFCEWMAKEVGVAAVPGSSFFKEEVNNLMRLHFARSKDVLDEALSRLAKLRELTK